MVCKDEIREKIVDISRNIYKSYGYKGTTMNHVAASLNMGKSSVYYYFKNKEELFRAVVLKEAKIFRKNLIAEIERIDDPREKLKIYILTRMRTLGLFHNFNNALKNAELSSLKFVKKLNNIYRMEEIRLIKNILKQGVEKQYFKLKNIELAASAYIMALRGLENGVIHVKSQAKFDVIINELLNVVFYGLIDQGQMKYA